MASMSTHNEENDREVEDKENEQDEEKDSLSDDEACQGGVHRFETAPGEAFVFGLPLRSRLHERPALVLHLVLPVNVDALSI